MCGNKLAVLFDLDGTLILMKKRENEQILRDLRYTSLKKQMTMKAVQYGLSFKEYEKTDRMAGILNKTRTLMDEQGFDLDTTNSLMFKLNELMAKYESEEHKDCMLAPGAIETLKKLKKNGYAMGIVTNTSERELLKIFNKFEIDKYVNVYVTRDDLFYVKPHPEPVIKILRKLKTKRFYYVGDSDHDAEAYRQALKLNQKDYQGKFILINTRNYNSKALESIRPNAIIHSLNELFPLLTKPKK